MHRFRDCLAIAIFRPEVGMERKSRPLAENHPSLEVLPVLRSGIGGRAIVEWSFQGLAIAQADIDVAADRLHMNWDYCDDQPEGVELEYGVEDGKVDAPRDAWFFCPKCRRRARKLHLYTGKWRCRTCHGLVYASQYMTEYDRLNEKLKTLIEETRGGRPRYVRQATHQAKLEQREALMLKLSQTKPAVTHMGISVRRIHAAYSIA